MYDYLIVGSGLFGSVFAHEMHKKGKSCLVIERHPQVGEKTFTAKTRMASISIPMAPTFSTRRTKKSGTMSISLSNLITTSILPLQTIKASSTIYPLT